MNVLTLSHVSKSFGQHRVIENLEFCIPEHTVYGFIGQNGAGKTTTMKIILGLLRADTGVITVNGKQVCYGQNHTNQFIGYLPDVPEFYGFLTPIEYLELCGEITGMEKREIRRRSEEMLELVGLSERKKRVQGFSRGMKQRLGIAQALLNRPKLLICDEPTSALDPVGRKEILDILHTVKEHTTVLFSTHILSDVERICDKIAFLHNGKLEFQGTLEEIRSQRQGRGFQLEFYRKEDVALFLKYFPGTVSEGGYKVLCERNMGNNMQNNMKYVEKNMTHAMEFVVKNNMAIRSIEMLETTLENLFMEVVGQ